MVPLSHICLTLHERWAHAHLFLFLEGMKTHDTTNKRLWSIADPVCTGAGYELIDVVLTQSNTGWVLRVFIDHLPNMPIDRTPNESESSDIGFDDCERVSRELSAVLDVEDPIVHAYSLEVSSPGLDRPLRKPAHFQRYLGQEAKVTLRHGIGGGRRNFKGTLVAFAEHQANHLQDEGSADAAPDGSADGIATAAPAIDSQSVAERRIGDDFESAILTMQVDGTEYRLPFRDIETARLVPDWDSLFQRDRRR
jgi:ribosome maturation factor RimP